MERKGRTNGQVGLPGVVATLEQSIAFLCQSPDLELPREELAAAIEKGDSAAASNAAKTLQDKLTLIAQLRKIADVIDPHVIDRARYRELSKMRPTALVEGALVEGKLRERRMILQAREAETNRFLARSAVVASIVALAIPFITWRLGR